MLCVYKKRPTSDDFKNLTTTCFFELESESGAALTKAKCKYYDSFCFLIKTNLNLSYVCVLYLFKIILNKLMRFNQLLEPQNKYHNFDIEIFYFEFTEKINYRAVV